MNSGRGSGMAFERRARDRHERHDERIDAERDEPLADLEDGVRAVAEAREDVGRDLAAAEHGNRRGEGAEIALDRNLRLARHDLAPKFRRHDLEMHAEAVDARAREPLEPSVVVGRLALRLDRQIDGGFHGRRAFAQDRRAAIAAGRGAGGHHHVLDAVELDGRASDFGELSRRLALNGPACRQRLADGAELAGLGAALIADAGLQDGGCEDVAAVQRRDVRIRDAVLGLQIVESRPLREADFGDRQAVAQDAARAKGVGFLDDVRALEGRRGMHRRHYRHAVDGQRLMIGWPRAAAPTFDASFRVSQPNAKALQLVDQLFGRKAHGHLLRRKAQAQTDPEARDAKDGPDADRAGR